MHHPEERCIEMQMHDKRQWKKLLKSWYEKNFPWLHVFLIWCIKVEIKETIHLLTAYMAYMFGYNRDSWLLSTGYHNIIHSLLAFNTSIGLFFDEHMMINFCHIYVLLCLLIVFTLKTHSEELSRECVKKKKKRNMLHGHEKASH